MKTDEHVNEKDELDDFIVEENESANKKVLAAIITPYVKSIGKNKVVDYAESYEKTPTWKKILVYLCCRKVMHIKGIIASEAAGPKEISEDHADISLDSAKGISRDSKLKGIVASNKGKYFIPNYRLKKVFDLVVDSPLKGE